MLGQAIRRDAFAVWLPAMHLSGLISEVDRAMASSFDPRLQSVVEGIVTFLQPEAVLLFGSRARGDHDYASDWDLFVVLPDDAATGCRYRKAVEITSRGKCGEAADPRRRLPSKCVRGQA